MKFQFPSNGKAYPKPVQEHIPPIAPVSFNSLQTGKPIQSEIYLGQKAKGISGFNSLQTGKPIQRLRCSQSIPMRRCFNSLQTGKPIQRFITRLVDEDHGMFQFPSNGKAYPKTTRKRIS